VRPFINPTHATKSLLLSSYCKGYLSHPDVRFLLVLRRGALCRLRSFARNRLRRVATACSARRDDQLPREKGKLTVRLRARTSRTHQKDKRTRCVIGARRMRPKLSSACGFDAYTSGERARLCHPPSSDRHDSQLRAVVPSLVVVLLASPFSGRPCI
jgi:hypothetical protein